MKRKLIKEKISKIYNRNPRLSYRVVAQKLNISHTFVIKLCNELKIKTYKTRTIPFYRVKILKNKLCKNFYEKIYNLFQRKTIQ